MRYTYNSNAIEGSTLTLEDTSLVLEGEFVPSDSPARYVFAARGVADGMAYVREYAKEGRKLNEELIRRLHEVTALDLQPFARGTFRPYGYLARIVYGQINVYSVTTKSERYERSYWTRTAAGNGIGGRKAPVPYGS